LPTFAKKNEGKSLDFLSWFKEVSKHYHGRMFKFFLLSYVSSKKKNSLKCPMNECHFGYTPKNYFE
jgi:hypothetical protein